MYCLCVCIVTVIGRHCLRLSSIISTLVFCLSVKLQLRYDLSYFLFIQTCLESSQRNRWIMIILACSLLIAVTKITLFFLAQSSFFLVLFFSISHSDGRQGVDWAFIAICFWLFVCLSVYTLQTKWLKIFWPNLVGSYYLVTSTSPFILEVRGRG